jgi:DNA-binding MarR family transcriptional regulator
LQSANKCSSRDLAEPDPFTREQFLAWRGFLRVHAHVTGELDRRMTEGHGLTLAQYGVLITLVSAPGMQLRMGELGARRLVSPSKISRVVDELEREQFVKRSRDPDDGRSFLATLTRRGLRRLREAQITHHAVVRERFLGGLSDREVNELAHIWDRAVPGVVDAEVWPPVELREAARR